ncbi:hypothetical protein ACFQZ4_09610 [Catellatospora coxensis]
MELVAHLVGVARGPAGATCRAVVAADSRSAASSVCWSAYARSQRARRARLACTYSVYAPP